MLKALLALILTILPALAQGDVLTNETVIKMVQAGVPTATIIKTISAADRIDFRFTGPNLQRLLDAKIPDDVFRAMVVRDKQDEQKLPAGSAVQQSASAPQPARVEPDKLTQHSEAEPPSVATRKTVELRAVRKIYIDKLDNNLDQYLRAEFFKQMKGAVNVVLDVTDADAILTGISDEEKGTGAKITGRYLGLHDIATGSLSLLSTDRRQILWSDEAGDRSLFFSAAHRGGERKVAERLVEKLKHAMGH